MRRDIDPPAGASDVNVEIGAVEANSETALTGKKHVLLIDDEPRMLRVMREILETADHTVFDALNGEAGLDVVLEQPVDLVITDIIMPEKEGIEAIAEIKVEHPYLPIIAISGGSLKGVGSYLETAAVLGACMTLAKPFHSSELLEFVDGALALNRATSPFEGDARAFPPDPPRLARSQRTREPYAGRLIA